MPGRCCEDCNAITYRRTRCRACGKLVCRWCYNHVHGPEVTSGDLRERAQSVPGVREPLGPADPVAGVTSAPGLPGMPEPLPRPATGGHAAGIPGRRE